MSNTLATAAPPCVETGLLARWSALLLCSACLRRGVRRPVPQVISRRHRPRALCPDCRAALAPASRPPPAVALRPV